jgi:hypothetical protein
VEDPSRSSLGVLRVEAGDDPQFLQLIQHPAEVPFTHPGHLPEFTGRGRPDFFLAPAPIPGVWAITGYQGSQHCKLPPVQVIGFPDPEEIVQHVVRVSPTAWHFLLLSTCGALTNTLDMV